MTIEEFVKKYKSGVDYDGMYGKQCVDYVNAYAKDVLGIKNAFVGIQYAYQAFTQYGKWTNIANNFIRVANAASNHPDKGDVIVWAKERNGYAGHIALVLAATAHSITVAEQNFDGKGGVRTYTYPNYNQVLGWLVPKSRKRNAPKIQAGQTVTLKKRAKLYYYNNSKSGVKPLQDFSDFEGDALLKVGAKLKLDKVITKANRNMWAFVEKYGGWICIYAYKDDSCKI